MQRKRHGEKYFPLRCDSSLGRRRKLIIRLWNLLSFPHRRNIRIIHRFLRKLSRKIRGSYANYYELFKLLKRQSDVLMDFLVKTK